MISGKLIASPKNSSVVDRVTWVLDPGDAARKLESTTTAKVVDSVLFLGSMASGVSSLVTAATAGLTNQLIDSMGIQSTQYQAALRVSSDVVLAAAVPSLGVPYLAAKVMRVPISRGSAYLVGQLPKDWTISQVLAYKAAQFAGTAVTAQVTENLMNAFSNSSQMSPSRSPESSQSPESEQASDSSQALDSPNVDQASVGQSGPSHKAKVYGYPDYHDSNGRGGWRFSEATVRNVRAEFRDGDCLIVEGKGSPFFTGLNPTFIERESKFHAEIGPLIHTSVRAYNAIQYGKKVGDTQLVTENCQVFTDMASKINVLRQGRNDMFESVVQRFAKECPGDVHFVAGYAHFTPAIRSLLTAIYNSRPDIAEASAHSKRMELDMLSQCAEWIKKSQDSTDG